MDFGVHFIDSGDYHYLTEFWTDKLTQPFNLVLFDHHTDMQPAQIEGLLSCGNWVQSMLDHQPLLRKVFLFGIPETQQTSIPAAYRDRVVIFSDSFLHRNLTDFLAN